MIIQCSACQTRFKLADEKLKPQGVKVRCTHCNEIFTVTPPPPETLAQPVKQAVAPAPAPPAPSDPSEFDFSDLGLDADSSAAPPPENTAADDDEFDFGEFNMEDLGEQEDISDPVAPTDQELQIDDFDLPDLSAPEQGEQQDSVREVMPGDLPPLEDFDLDDNDFEGFDSNSETEPGGGQGGDLIFDDEPAIGGDLGETYEDDSHGEELPDLDDAFTSGPREFSFDDDADDPFLGDSVDNSGGPVEFSFDEEVQKDAPPSAHKKKSASPGSEFVFEEESGQDEADFTDISFESPQPDKMPPAAAAAAAAPRTVAPKTVAKSAPQPRSARRKGPKTKRRKQKSHRRGPLLFLLFILLLAGGYGYFGWTQGIYDPAVLIERARSMIQGQTTPDQIGLIEIRNLRNQFVVNQNAGQLFVVHGEAVNRFNGARSSISVKGMIYDKDGKAILQQTVFCGNPLDEAALRTLPYAKIEESMNNQFGEALSNLNLAADQAIPFTIVFRNLPAEIAQFNVEVADSRPGSK